MRIARKSGIGLVSALIASLLTTSPSLAAFEPAEFPANVVIVPQGEFTGIGYTYLQIGGNLGSSLILDDAVTHPVREVNVDGSYFSSINLSDAFDTWGEIVLQEPDGDSAPIVVIPETCENSIPDVAMSWAGTGMANTGFTFTCQAETMTLQGQTFDPVVSLILEGSYATWEVDLGQSDHSGGLIDLQAWVLGNVGSDRETFIVDKGSNWAVTSGDKSDPVLGFKASEPFDFTLLDIETIQQLAPGDDWLTSQPGADNTVIHLQNLVSDSNEGSDFSVSTMLLDYMPPFYEDAQNHAVTAIQRNTTTACWNTVDSNAFTLANQCGLPVSAPYRETQLLSDPGNPAGELVSPSPSVAYNPIPGKWLSAWVEDTANGLQLIGSAGTEITDSNNDMVVVTLTSPGEETLPPVDGDSVTVVAAGDKGWVVFWVDPTFTEIWGLQVLPNLSVGAVTQFSDGSVSIPDEGYLDVGSLSAVPNSDFTKILLTWRASNTDADALSSNQTVGTVLDISSGIAANGDDLLLTNFDPGVGFNQDLSYSPVEDEWAALSAMVDGQGLALSFVNSLGSITYSAEIYPSSFGFDGLPYIIEGASIEYNSSSNLYSLVATIVDDNGQGHLMTIWLDSAGDFTWPAPIFLDLQQNRPGKPETVSLGLRGNLTVWSSGGGLCSETLSPWCENDTIYGLIMTPEPNFKMFGLGDYFGQHLDPEVSANSDNGEVLMTWRGSEFDFDNNLPGIDLNYATVLCADGCNPTSNGTQEAMVVTRTTVWVPANSVIPALGSTVNFSFDANLVGSGYANLSETYTQAPVLSIAADYPLSCNGNEACIGQEGDIGFGIVFDFDEVFQGFGDSFNIILDIPQQATSYDSVFADHAYGMQDGENFGVWFPNGRDYTSASSLLNEWAGTEINILAVETNVDLICPEWFAEGDCLDHEGTSGSFLIVLESPDSNALDVFTGPDGFGSLLNSSVLVRGVTATMDTDYSSGGDWCAPRHAKIQNEVFLGGSFIELGISETGSFGTVSNGPEFMRGAGNVRPAPIGMAADLDGYCQGTDLPIDFFVPGTPEERWSLGFIENDGDEPRYISYAPIMSDHFNDGELPFLRSDELITIEGAVEDISTETRLMARSTNIIYDDGEPIFEVIVTHSLSPENPFYRTEYIVNNISHRDFFNVRLMRNVDPDNTVFQNESTEGGDGYETRNLILDQVEVGGTAQVQASALLNDPFLTTLDGFGITTTVPLVFYSNDERAVASFGGFTEPNPYEISATDFFFDSDPEFDGSPFDPIANMQAKDFFTSCDCAIQMSADFGDVSAGTQLAPFTMYTSLDSRDFSEVIDEVVVDMNEPDLLFPIQEFNSGNLFNSVANSITQDFTLQNLKINDLSQAEFNSLDPLDKGFAAAFGRFSAADRYVGLGEGFVLNPGYKASSFGYSSMGNMDENYFSPDSDSQAYLYPPSQVSSFDDQNYPDTPVGALAKAVDLDSNIPLGNNNEKALYGATSVSFSLTPQSRYFKLDFVLAMTETGEFNPETEKWEGYISEFADGVGVFVKGEEDDWLSAENCAAIPTTNSYLSMQSAGVLSPGSPSLTRQIATDNYLSLVAKTAVEGYQLNQNSFVDRNLEQDEGDLIAPPGIAISNRSLGSVLKFVTIPMTCVIDLQANGLDAGDIEVGMVVANVYDAVLPPALFISTDSIRFADDQIAAPISIEAQVQDRADELYQVFTSPATAFDGPIVSAAIQIKTAKGASLKLSGKKLDSVTNVDVYGQNCKLISATSSNLTCDLSKPLPIGRYSISLEGPFGKLTATDALVVIESLAQPADMRIKVTETGAKVYVLNPVGLGKIQIFVDGKEKFWVRAKSSKDKKLFKGYVARSLKLKPGQTLKLLVNGELVDSYTQD